MSHGAPQVFSSFDQDSDGFISGQELASLLHGPSGQRGWSELDGRVDYVIPDTLQAVLRHADVNGDGHLSFEEFLALLQVGRGLWEAFGARGGAMGVWRGGARAEGGGAQQSACSLDTPGLTSAMVCACLCVYFVGARGGGQGYREEGCRRGGGVVCVVGGCGGVVTSWVGLRRSMSSCHIMCRRSLHDVQEVLSLIRMLLCTDWCCAVLCCAMLCHVMPCCAVLCCSD